MSYPCDLRDHFWTDGCAPTGREIDASLPQLLSVFAAGNIVEIACDDANHASAWSRAHGFDYFGLDIPPQAAKLTTTSGVNAALIDDAAQLPLHDRSDGSILCTEVLEHLFAPLDAAQEMPRALTPDGIAIVSVPHVAHWRHRIDLLVLVRWAPGGTRETWRDPHLRFFTERTLRRLLEAARFYVVSTGGISDSLAARSALVRKVNLPPGPERSMSIPSQIRPSLFPSHLWALAAER